MLENLGGPYKAFGGHDSISSSFSRQMARSRLTMKSAVSDASGEEAGQIFTDTGVYKGNAVAVLRVQNAVLSLTRQDLLELKEVPLKSSSKTFSPGNK